MTGGQRRGVRFGAFELDLGTGELRAHGRKVRLAEQPFRVLVTLLQRPGEVVSSDELRHEIWDSGTHVDFEHSLHNAVNKLRRALRDSHASPRFIETIPRRGYRFLAGVEWIEEPRQPGEARSAGGLAVEPPAPAPVPRWRRPRFWAWVVGLAGLLAAGAWWIWKPGGPQRCTHPAGLGSRVTALQEFKGGVLVAYHSPGSDGPWGAFLRRDVRNLDLSDATRAPLSYSGKAHIEDLVVIPGGVLTAVYQPSWRKDVWEVYFSPDGGNLSGGGKSIQVYQGAACVDRIVPFRGGVLTALYGSSPGDRHGVYFSPDARNLDGGGATIKVYSGPYRVDALTAFQDGVITAFYDPRTQEAKGIYFSPNGRDLGGGGSTVPVYSGVARVQAMTVTASGVLTAFYSRAGQSWGIYLSPDGRFLGGGGRTTLAYNGLAYVDTLLPYEGGVLTAFYGPIRGRSLGIYFSPDSKNLAGGEETRRVYPGVARVSAMTRVGSGVLTAFYDPDGRNPAGIYFSPDGRNLGGGGATVPVSR